MKDFLLTEKGDLVFRHKNSLASMEISYTTNQHPGFCLQFKTINENEIQPRSRFHLMFKTAASPVKSGAVLVDGLDALTQNIKIRLASQRGEIRDRLNVGSEVHLLKHAPVTDPSLIGRIQKEIEQALQDIVPGISVKVTREKMHGYNLKYSGYVANIFQYGQKLLRFYI